MCSKSKTSMSPRKCEYFQSHFWPVFFLLEGVIRITQNFSIVLNSRRNVNVRFSWLIENFKMWLNLVAIILLGNSSIGRYNNRIIVPNVNKILPTCTCVGINCKSCSNIQTRIASKETFSEKTVGNNFAWA